jgi:hypothetical protein
LCLNIFEPVYDQVLIASASRSYKRRRDVCSHQSVMASEPTSIKDLPKEILLKIFSHFGPEDLSLKISKVCKNWNVLAKDVVLWRKLCYSCNSSYRRIAEVRCTALLVCRNFAPVSVLKVQNLKEHFRN